MNKPPDNSPRARLQTLLKIPESKRTDAEWDEIHELEIEFAPAHIQRAPQHRLPVAGNAPPPARNDQREGSRKKLKRDGQRRHDRKRR